MKMRILTYIVCLVCSIQMSATNQSGKSTINVDKDTTICLNKLSEKDSLKYIYGTPYQNGNKTCYYGGDEDKYFNKNVVEPNKNSGIFIDRNISDGIKLQVTYDSLNDTVSLIFPYAYYKNNQDGWCPDSTNKIKIELVKIFKKEDHEEGPDSTGDEPTTPSQESQSEVLSLDELLSKPYMAIFLILVIMLFFLLSLKIKLNKILKNNKNEGKGGELDKKIEIISEQLQKLKMTQLTEEDVNKLINKTISESTTVLSKDDIIKLINDKVATPITNTPINTNEIHHGTPVKKKKGVSINTDNVVYNWDNNSFSVGETEMKIFRIFSRENDFFYTLIDNEGLRDELLGIISSYDNCVNVLANSNGKHLTVEKEGKLIKDGNNFIVDSNNKLTLKLV